MSESGDNPYAVPEQSVVDHSPSRDGFSGTQTGWLLVFVLNVPIALMFAQAVVSGNATIGMVFALATLIVVGWLLTPHAPQTMRAIFTGGMLTALSQTVPILHIIAGQIALFLTSRIVAQVETENFDVIEFSNFFGGFCATVLTALLVIIVAAGLGFLIGFFRKPVSIG